MMHRFTRTVLTAAVLFVSFTLAFAETGKTGVKSNADSKTAIKNAKKPAKKKVKLVDINSAGKADLMKLPGITAASAASIIAHRPYGSKAHLVTKKALTSGDYQAISHLVIAKQPYADSAKNAETLKAKK